VVCGPGLLASCIVSRPGPRAAPRGCLCPARPATVLVSPAAPARARSSYCPAPPAAQAGTMAACRYIMTAGRRSGRKPGWRATWCCRRAPAARPPTAVVFPCAGTTGNPGQDHRWRRLLSCSSGMRLPPRGVPVVPRRGDGWPAREHLTGWRGGDQAGQVLASLDPASRGVPLWVH